MSLHSPDALLEIEAMANCRFPTPPMSRTRNPETNHAKILKAAPAGILGRVCVSAGQHVRAGDVLFVARNEVRSTTYELRSYQCH
jgi:biotin carboxyl carrier protein